MIALAAVLCLQAAAARPSEMQDPDRLPIPGSDLKALRDNNIFSPHRAKAERTSPRREERRSEPRSEAPAPKSKPPVVTGIFFDETAKAYQAVVEDRNEEKLRVLKAPRYLKAGDEMSGLKVQSVASDKIVLLHGEATKELRVGESLPETDARPSAESGAGAGTTTTSEKPPAETTPQDDAATEETKKKLKERNKKNRPSDLYDPP